MDVDLGQIWMKEFYDFVSHWEKEIDSLKSMKINPEECNLICESFHKDKNMLLCRKPSSFNDDELISKLNPLVNKLDSCLAMASE